MLASCALALVCLAPIASAQGQAQAPLAIPTPNYVSIPMEITVNRPAAEVWKRVGKYCDIGEWGGFGGCTVTMLRNGAESCFRQEIAALYQRQFHIAPKVYACIASAGAGEDILP